MSFVPLHANSVYTFLSSALTIDDYIKAAKANKITSLALTDNNSLIACVHFFDACKKNNIKPLIGLDLTIDDLLLTFIVKNENGYTNLLKISKLYNSNRISINDIKTYQDGLVVILSSKINNLNKLMKEKSEMDFSFYLKRISDNIDNFYIGLETYNGIEKEENEKLRKFLLNRNYLLLAFPFIRYIKKEEELTYQIVTAIKNETKLEENINGIIGENYFYSFDEINKLYEREDIENTYKLSEEINFDLIKKRGKLVKFSSNSDELLKEESYRLLKEKVNFDYRYQSRLDYELKVIKNMGYSDYFLIVADYVKFAKEHDIYVGPGRGSAGGSLVAYALNIITIDPLKANLIFERFLNSGRKSMPDIDVDFEDTRRDEVFNYIRKRYGSDKVGNIITSQTLKAKAAIRDIGRIFDVKDRYIEELCKSLGEYDDLRDGYRYSTQFKKIVDSDKYYLFIVKMAKKIEGFPRQAGMHAAGVIINDEPLDNSLPIYINGFEDYLSQLEKDDLETLGFLKMDVLGLRNLTIVRSVIEDVNKEKKILDYNSLPYEDEDAIRLIATGETIGLFQLESKGMIRTIKEFNPKTFEDVVSLIALYRPGPMKFIPQYIARKEGKEKVVYPSKKIENVLESTYGIIVYQEQIMEIARLMAGFSYQEADLFRRAISKKNASKLADLKENFIKGSLKNGSNEKESEDVFNLIYRFANYGFNRSHAYAYAKLATQMAYLKYHYPSYFYSATLDSGDRFNDVVAEIRRRNIKLRLPDINKASYRYVANNDELYMPLIGIKGILTQSVYNLIKEREEKGIYKSFIDFVIRNQKYKISSTTILKLIDAGAFDSFAYTRASLRNSLNKIIEYAKLIENENGQMIIDSSIVEPPNIENIKDDDLYNINKEEESLGITLSKSIFDFYKEDIIKEGAVSIEKIKEIKFGTIIGKIHSIRRTKTKTKNESMCFITISDDIDDLNLTLFPDTYKKYEEILYSAKIIIVQGKYEESHGEFIVKTVKAL